MVSATTSSKSSARAWAKLLWFWGRVVLILLLIDVLLFQTTWVWRPRPGDALHALERRIETHQGGAPVAIAVGSSVVRMSGSERRVGRRLSRAGIETTFRNFGLDGIRANEAALVAHVARAMKPWLIVYGSTFRDFMVDTRPGRDQEKAASRVQVRLLDSSFEIDAVAPDSVDEWLTRVIRRHWRLYRFRDHVRWALEGQLEEWAARLTTRAEAATPRPRRRQARPPVFTARLEDSASYPAWQRWLQSRTFADYERYLALRGKTLELYRRNRRAPFDLATSLEVQGLEHLLRTSRARGTRVVVAYFPENPVFRDPAASEYFDPRRSAEVAGLLEREAAQYGARFVDLRDLLPAEDFLDMVHPNERGAVALNDALIRIVAEEWRAANEAAVTDGAFVP